MRLTKGYNKVRAMRRGLLVLLFLLSLATAGAKTRIMLISDPHVMGPGLLISEGEAWENAIYYDRKLNDYSRAIFDEVIAIALKEKPDLFLISGDLTKDGEWLSHKYVVSKLYELKAVGIQPFVIPGNHDLGTPEALYFDDDDSYKADTINAKQFVELYRDFGYGEGSEREATTLSWCYEPIDGLVLIGLDTGHDGDPLNGVVSTTTLRWMSEQAKKATKAGKRVLMMMHHTLFPHVTNTEKFSSTYCVKLGVKRDDGSYSYYGYSDIRDYLADAGGAVVLSGHVHASDIAKDANYNFTRTVHDICTASCAAFPNPYRLLTLNDDGATMRIQTRYITELPGVDDFAALAEERMTQGLVNLVNNISHSLEVAELFADIFKIHVAGNEPENPRQQEFLMKYEEELPRMKENVMINNYLTAYGVTFDELTQMVHSMLEDKSYYGNPARESLDDDLNTTIPVHGDGWTAIRGVKVGDRRQESGDRSREEWYTLQGVKIAKPGRKGVYIHKDASGTQLIHNK